MKLDAAATADSALVDDYFGPDHFDPARRDALLLDWTAHAGGGTVYLNPPYAVPLLRKFLAHAVETAAAGTEVVGLVPASTGTIWWRRFVTVPDAEVEFITGRLRFGGPHASGGPAPFASALVRWC